MNAGVVVPLVLFLATTTTHAQLFNVDPCCTSATNQSCCVVSQVTPSIRLATRLELINTLCSPFCARYQTCLSSLGNGSITLASNNSVVNASGVSYYTTVNFVLGNNYCALQCLADSGVFANATFQSACINAATVNGTCSDACRAALRQVDPQCRAAMQDNSQAGFQSKLLFNVCGITQPAPGAAGPLVASMGVLGTVLLSMLVVCISHWWS